MSVNVTIAGTTYPFPTNGEEDWGTVVTNWAIAVSSQLLQRTGGSFSLTNDVNFGATFATIQTYLKSRTSNIASAGFVRMARADTVSWRNQLNDGNLPLAVDSSNRLTFNGNVIIPSTGVIQPTEGGTGLSSYTTGDTLYASASNVLSKLGIGSANRVYTSDGSIPAWALLVNANIDAAAAIAYSKLALTGSIVDADVNASAAIAYSKLAALTASKLLESSVGGVITVATGSGYPKLTSGSPAYSSTIPRADIATATNYRILANNSSGVMSENAALTPAHVIIADSNGQLAGEAQLAISRGGTNLSSYTQGDILYCSATNVLSKLGIGASGTFIKSNGTIPGWSTATSTFAKQSKAANFSLDASIDVYECDSSGGTFTATVPAAGTNTGKVWYLLKTDTSFTAVSLGTGLVTTLNTQGECLAIFDDGTTIRILNRYIPDLWTTYTTSWTGSSVNPAIVNGTLAASWKRIGSVMQIQINVTAGSSTTYGTGTWFWSVPSGVTIDSASIPGGVAGNVIMPVGGRLGVALDDSGPANVFITGNYVDTGKFGAYSFNCGGTNLATGSVISNNSPFTWATSDRVYFVAEFPISGWNG